MGDPAGVGPDIALKAWLSRRQIGLSPFFVVGDPEILATRAHLLGVSVDIEEVSPPLSKSLGDSERLPVLPIPVARPAEAGSPDPENATATIEAIRTAVALIRDGIAGAVVTNPINKAVMYEAGFEHPGHTEYLGELAGQWGVAAYPVMMLAADILKVVPVTVHIPFADVHAELNEDRIVRTVTVLAKDLKERFAISEPRIAIAGLNPHAGEGGSIGCEEQTIIKPAIRRLADTGLAVSGPYPADTMFHAPARATYDAAVAMYHDQALIPIKTLAFERAVNMTLGLPFVRTSPDHGTAYDIAGTGRADPTSLINALQLAQDVVGRPEPVS